MIKAVTENDELVNVKATKDGKLMVETSGGEEGTTGDNEVKIINEEANPIPAKITNPVSIPESFKINNEETAPVPTKVTNPVTIPNNFKVNNEDSAPVPVKVISGITTPTEIKINNTSDSAVPVALQGQEVETTLNASIQTIGTEATSVAINKKVTSIDIANYSDEADLTVTIGTLTATIGANISATLPINKDVTNISLTSTAADTKVQLIVKGVEE